MSVFSDLAKLRLGMPVTELLRLLEPGAQPGRDGWLRTSNLDTRIDTDGRIVVIHISEDFPSNIDIDGLHIGMTLDQLSIDPRGFHLVPRQNPLRTPYQATMPGGDRITAMVGPQGYVRRIEFARPDATVSTANDRFGPYYGLRVPTYNDNAELLADWAGRSTFTDTYPIRHAEAHWLQHEATPEDWHWYVMHHNWDEGLEPLLWIIRQAECEAATALLAFYMSRPGQNLDYVFDSSLLPGWAREGHDLIVEIRDRFLAGSYTAATIAFDADLALQDEAYLPPEPNQAALDELIPPPMRRNIPGDTFDFKKGPTNPPRPELFRLPVATLLPPPITLDEEISRARGEATAKTLSGLGRKLSTATASSSRGTTAPLGYKLIERSITKQLRTLIGCLVFVLVCLPLLENTNTATRFVGWTGFALFDGGGLAYLMIGWRANSSLTLDDDGFEFATWRRRVRYAWRDVTRFTIVELGWRRTKMIGFSITKSPSPTQRLGTNLLGVACGLPNVFKISLEELADLMNAYRDNAANRS